MIDPRNGCKHIAKESGNAKREKSLKSTKVPAAQHFPAISLFSKRQSDRNVPCAAFNAGVTSLSGINGQEYIGLSLLTIFALPGMLRDSKKEKAYCDLLWKGVLLATILDEANVPEEDNPMLGQKCRCYVQVFVTVCHDDCYKKYLVGTKLPKMPWAY